MNRNVLVFHLPYVRIKGHAHAILLVLTLVCIVLCKSVYVMLEVVLVTFKLFVIILGLVSILIFTSHILHNCNNV